LKPSYGQACVHESDKLASSFAVFQAVFSSTVVRHSSFIILVHLMIIKVLCFNLILNWFSQLVSGDSQNQLDLLEPGYWWVGKNKCSFSQIVLRTNWKLLIKDIWNVCFSYTLGHLQPNPLFRASTNVHHIQHR
jgi:hypothetical protein